MSARMSVTRALDLRKAVLFFVRQRPGIGGPNLNHISRVIRYCWPADWRLEGRHRRYTNTEVYAMVNELCDQGEITDMGDENGAYLFIQDPALAALTDHPTENAAEVNLRAITLAKADLLAVEAAS